MKKMGPFEAEYKALYPLVPDKEFEPTKEEASAGREYFFEQLLKIHWNTAGTNPKEEPIISNENILLHILLPFGMILAVYVLASIFLSVSQ